MKTSGSTQASLHITLNHFFAHSLITGSTLKWAFGIVLKMNTFVRGHFREHENVNTLTKLSVKVFKDISLFWFGGLVSKETVCCIGGKVKH